MSFLFGAEGSLSGPEEHAPLVGELVRCARARELGGVVLGGIVAIEYPTEETPATTSVLKPVAPAHPERLALALLQAGDFSGAAIDGAKALAAGEPQPFSAMPAWLALADNLQPEGVL